MEREVDPSWDGRSRPWELWDMDWTREEMVERMRSKGVKEEDIERILEYPGWGGLVPPAPRHIWPKDEEEL